MSNQSRYSNPSMFYAPAHGAGVSTGPVHPHPRVPASSAYASYGGYPQMQRQSRSNPPRGQYAASTSSTACASSMRLPSMCQPSISQPPPSQATERHSGIVLQSLSQASQAKQARMASVGGGVSCGYPMDAMAQTLAQYAQYTQPQLQQVLAAYPPWFQKELMRRLQRQYEEMYVVEDPKILHLSAICPRLARPEPSPTHDAKKKALPQTNPSHSHNGASQHSAMSMASPASACGRSSCHFLSPSASLSASPYPHFDGAYSPHHHQLEATTSPHEHSCEHEHSSLEPQALDTSQQLSHSELKSPRSPRTPRTVSMSMQPTSRLSCFQILDFIATDNEASDEDDTDKEAVPEEEEEEEEEEDEREKNEQLASPRVEAPSQP